MKLCPACSCHVRRDATTCPMCHATLSAATTSATSAAALALTLAAGLALSGCTGDDGETTATTTSTSSTSSTTTDDSSSSSTSTSTSTTAMSSAESSVGVAAYAGPPVDTNGNSDRALPPDADAPPSVDPEDPDASAPTVAAEAADDDDA
ncbi:MAG: hypothetical protein KC486_26670 [Myxococcales bacterium]|nr:hypothetical protein [Myxococcales bacterium]